MNKILNAYLETEAEVILTEGWRSVAAAAMMGAAALNPMSAAGNKEKLPAHYTQNITDDAMLNYFKNVENGIKSGYKNGKWFPHNSAEGGLPTIAYGHKITPTELQRLKLGITEAEALAFLKADITKARNQASKDFKNITKRNFEELPQTAQIMLTDIAFNLGTVKKFKKFSIALATGNIKNALAEYKRSYVDGKGVRHELKDRNAKFKDTFLDPWIVAMRAGFKPLKGKNLKYASVPPKAAPSTKQVAIPNTVPPIGK